MEPSDEEPEHSLHQYTGLQTAAHFHWSLFYTEDYWMLCIAGEECYCTVVSCCLGPDDKLELMQHCTVASELHGIVDEGLASEPADILDEEFQNIVAPQLLASWHTGALLLRHLLAVLSRNL